MRIFGGSKGGSNLARSRLLKPGFLKNEELARLSFAHRILFEGLWLIADREGRLDDRPARIKIEVFPYDDSITAAVIDQMLDDLDDAGFIQRFTYDPLTKEGPVPGLIKGKAVAVTNFKKHQSPHHREPASIIPSPTSRRAKAITAALALPGQSPGNAKAEPQPSRAETVPDPESVPVPESESLSGSKSSPARAGRSAAVADESPDQNLGVITKLVHEALDLNGNNSDLPEVVKQLCAEHHIRYDSTVVQKAIDSARVQRKHGHR